MSNLVLPILLAEKGWWVLQDVDDVHEVLPPADLHACLPLLVLRLRIAAGLQQDFRQLPTAHRRRYVQRCVPVLKQASSDGDHDNFGNDNDDVLKQCHQMVMVVMF